MTESQAIISTKSSSELSKTPTRILSVDDDSAFLKVTKQILEVNDAFQVDLASSADEAMDKLKKKTYDAVVSDYQMPGKDGLDFLKEVRDDGNTIPFIIFTGKGREEIAIESLNLGADGYFNKLGDTETVYGELVHGIHQVVERKRAEEALKESEEALKKAQNIAKIGSWEMDTITKKLVWSNQLYDILEISQHQEPTFDLYYSRVHPDDLAYVQEVGAKVFKDNEARIAEYRLLLPSKTTKYIATEGRQILDEKTISLN